jgi:hypothetical protein
MIPTRKAINELIAAAIRPYAEILHGMQIELHHLDERVSMISKTWEKQLTETTPHDQLRAFKSELEMLQNQFREFRTQLNYGAIIDHAKRLVEVERRLVVMQQELGRIKNPLLLPRPRRAK